jgi:hypothetical protein
MPFLERLPDPLEPQEGTEMTVTRPTGQDKERPRAVSPKVTQGLRAAQGFLLAVATAITAVTGLIIALTRG